MKKIRKSFCIGLSSLSAVVFLAGCSQTLLFEPKGPIGDAERFVIIVSFALMLIVVIPVFIMAIWFPWKYRASNTKASYDPKWSHSIKIESIVWLVPVVIVTTLGVMVWKTTHQLDPHKPIETGVKPIIIEVVSLDWKWLFIYPEQQIATVNQIVFPVNAPLNFTSATVMTSFFIPQLGSQVYAMAGMQTQLHLLADEPGTYTGQNQQLSGEGYADMNFKALAVSREEFESWINKVRHSTGKLDLARYMELEQPSVDEPVTHFSTVKPDLFEHVIGKYNTAMNMNHDTLIRKPKAQMNPSAPEKN
ncbi:MAG: ubiquinol oxidase subunit II [Desulfobulbales bacterium]